MKKILLSSLLPLIALILFGCSSEVEYSAEQIAEKLKVYGGECNIPTATVELALITESLTPSQAKKHIDTLCNYAANWLIENATTKQIARVMSSTEDKYDDAVFELTSSAYDAAEKANPIKINSLYE